MIVLKTGKKKRSVILQIGIIALALGLAVSLIQLQMQISRANEQYEKLQHEIADAKFEQEKLQDFLDNEDQSEYIERIAREKLGYVMPDEKVFYDVAGN